MIRKPQATDFQEGAAVTAIRESRKIAVEGSKGVGHGIAKIYCYWFVFIMSFGFVVSALTTLNATALGLLLGGAFFVWAIYRMNRPGPLGTCRSANAFSSGLVNAFSSSTRRDEGAEQAERVKPAVRQNGEEHLDISALVRQAVTLLIPGMFLVIMPATLLMICGIILLAAGLLLVARVFSDRVALRYDARSIIVSGVLGRSEMLWVDAEDVFVRVSSRFNLLVLFTSGGRRNIVVRAGRNSLGGPRELLIPVDLLALEREELVRLVANLICCRGAGGEIVPSWQKDAPRAGPVPAPAPSPSGDPRQSFDPDAIMARYLAEREQVVAEVRPDLARPSPASRPTFGRKIS